MNTGFTCLGVPKLSEGTDELYWFAGGLDHFVRPEGNMVRVIYNSLAWSFFTDFPVSPVKTRKIDIFFVI